MSWMREQCDNGFTVHGFKFWMCDPIVKVISRPQVLDVTLADFFEEMGLEKPREDQMLGTQAEVLIETAGRDCYLSNGVGRSTGEYIENLKLQAHGSVFEHANFTFKIGAVSRGLTHELVRHRVGVAISQVSSRYVDPHKLGFVMPHKSRGDAFAEDLFIGSALTGIEAYDVLVKTRLRAFEAVGISKAACIKQIRGEAREHLPIGLAQILTFTVNARTLRHIVTMRASRHAETQIQALANAMLEEVAPFMPRVMMDWKSGEFEYGAF